MKLSGGGQSKPYNIPDTFRSRDTIEMLLGLGEGPWWGPAEGPYSIFFDQTPIVAADGSSNFKNVGLTFYPGSAFGEVISLKLGGASSPISGGVTLAKSTPVVRAGTQTGIDLLEMRLVVGGLYNSTDDGLRAASAIVRVEYRRSDETEWHPTIIYNNPPPPTTTGPAGSAANYVIAPPATASDISTAIPIVLSDTAPVGVPTIGGETILDTSDSWRPYVWDEETEDWVSDATLDTDDDVAFWVYTDPQGRSRRVFMGSSDVIITSGELTQGDLQVRGGLPYGYNGTSWEILDEPGRAEMDNGIVYIDEKITSTSVKEFRVVVPNVDVPLEYRVTKESNDTGSPETLVSEITLDGFEEIRAKTFLFPNTACLSLIAQASDQFSSIPTIQSKQKMRIVRVPTNYDPDTRVYTGTWDGTYKMAWIDNPAWVFLDFVENSTFGLSSIYPHTCSKANIYAWAQWCDGLVPDGRGGTRPRWTFNHWQTEAIDAKEFAQIVAAAGGARYTDDGNGEIIVLFEHDGEQAVSVFANENVEDGLFEYTFTNRQTRPNIIWVSYKNADQFYRTDRRPVKDQDDIDLYGMIPEEFDAKGCRNLSEALARARHRLVTGLTETQTVSFKTHRKGRYLRPWQVILVADADANHGLSTMVVSASGSEVVLRDQVTLEPGFTYQMSVDVVNPSYPATSDNQYVLHTFDIVTGAGVHTTIEIDGTLPTLPEFCTVSIGCADTIGLPKAFRVLSIEAVQDNPDKVEIQALEINRNKWAFIDGTDDEFPDEDTSEFYNGVITPASDLSVSFRNVMRGLRSYRVATLNWTASESKYVRQYRVLHSLNGSPFTEIGLTADTWFEIFDITEGQHAFAVSPMDFYGAEGRSIGYSVNVTGDLRPGSKVSDVRLSGGGSSFTGTAATFLWSDEAVDPDFSHYLAQVLVDDEVIRSEITQERTWTYDFDKQTEDGLNRAIVFKVCKVDRFGVVYPGVALGVSNPVPALPSSVTYTATTLGARLTVTRPADPDIKGLLVWVSETSGFNPLTTIPTFNVDQDQVEVPIPSGATRYVRVAFYDSHGTTGLNITAEQSVTPALLNSANLGPSVFDSVQAMIDVLADDIDDLFGSTASAAASASAAATHAANAATAETNAETAQAAAETARTAAQAANTSAAAQATAAATSASTAATAATNAATARTAAETARDAAVTARTLAQSAQTSAETAATDAAASALAAGAGATAAGGSATAASGHATNASNSATAASGSATAAASSATAAAASATAASGSATAAATSATSAGTSATNAGNSASAASTSAVSAQSVANRILPDRPSVAADFVSSDSAGAPDSATPTASGTVTAVSGEGDVRQGSDFASLTRGVLAVGSGRTFRSELRTRITTSGTNNVCRHSFLALDSSYAVLGQVQFTDHPLTTVNAWQNLSIETTSAAILAAYPTAAYIRSRARNGLNSATGAASGANAQIAIQRLRDVTSEAAAAGSATAAASSASSAATSATSAGTSASAASTSATNAATSAGAASTSAGQASTSATTAAGHASSASTSATNAANSASAAAGSASAASSSASSAATSATSAGTSATTATTQAGIATTKAGEASTSASQAATSATTAGGHAATASTQATNAANSATAAAGSATAASGSASTASTQATNAGNSATAAASSAVTASSASAAAVAVARDLLPARCDNASYFSDGGAVAPSSIGLTGYTLQTHVTHGPYLAPIDTANRAAAPRGMIAHNPDAIYEVVTRYFILSNGGTGSVYIRHGLYSASASYTVVDDNVQPTAGDALRTVADGVVTNTILVGGSNTNASHSDQKLSASAVWWRPHIRANAGGATSGQMGLLEIRIRDVTAQVAAAQSASAAATSASSAATSASGAATSASAASTSATNAATSAGSASTSATNASNSATTAAGHAATSSTQATNAANSATAAAGSATAASGSASSAATSATTAGNSAAAASSSEVRAHLTAAALGPRDFAQPKQWTYQYNAVPASAPDVTAAYFTLGTYAGGQTFRVGDATISLRPKAYFPVVSGDKIRLKGAVQALTDGAGSCAIILRLGGFDAPGGGTFKQNVSHIVTSNLTVANGVVTFDQILTVPTGGSTWFQPVLERSAGGASLIEFISFTFENVTSKEAAAGSASSAASSASAAATSATDAGTSASAAATSATNAATSAGSASTSATNASNSATTAAGHAATSSTQATNAANSATAAAGSASAASGSASTASTSATNAGNSATAASSAQVAAQSHAAGNIVAKGTFGDSSVGTWSGNVTAYTVSPAAPDGATKVLRSTNRDSYEGAIRPGAWASRKLRVSGYARAPGSFACNVGVNTINSSGTNGWPVMQAAAAGTTTWQPFSFVLTLASDIVSLRPFVQSNGTNGVAGHDVQVTSLLIEDVTGSEAAAASASAAATSASSASTSASGAATSASAASTSATNASTSAGQASTYAGQASTSATNAAASATTAGNHASTASGHASAASSSAAAASTSASAAATSATLSAQYNLAPNANLFRYPNGLANNAAASTIGWVSSGGVAGVSGLTMGYWAPSGGPGYFETWSSGFTSSGDRYHYWDTYVAASGTFTVSAGGYAAGGLSAYLSIEALNSAKSTVLASSGSVVFPGTSGRAVRSVVAPSGTIWVRIVITIPAQTRTGWTELMLRQIKLEAGATATAYNEAESVRAAQADIITNASAIATETAARASADSALSTSLGGLSATVSTQATAISTLQGAAAMWETVVAASGGDLAAVRLRAGQGGSFLELISTVLRLANVSNGAVIEVMRAIGGEAYFSRPVSSDGGGKRLTVGPAYGATGSEVLLWAGADTVAPAAQSRANASVALGSDGVLYKNGVALGVQATANSQRGSTYSGTPTEGSWWVDTSTDKLKYFTGGNWYDVADLATAPSVATGQTTVSNLNTSGATWVTVMTVDLNVAAGGYLESIGTGLGGALGSTPLSSGSSFAGNWKITEDLQAGGSETVVWSGSWSVAVSGIDVDVVVNDLPTAPKAATLSGACRYKLQVQRASGSNNVSNNGVNGVMTIRWSK